ncbi:MAG: VanZ family protein [Acidobacteria bacterium]|nr:VanZ family protein [Acidobacteriota bacterium]MBS1867275.1 VanZ family protein [Acidobacteriota bacterium]
MAIPPSKLAHPTIPNADSRWPDLLSTFLRKKKLLGFLFLLIFAGIGAATLWPFDLFSPNGAGWIPGRSGLRFSTPGVLISSAPLLVPASEANNPVSIELWLRSDEIWSRRAALAVYHSSDASQFVIRQWNGGLLISRDSHSNAGRAASEKIYAKDFFRRGQPMFLAIVSSSGGTSIYVDGVWRRSFPNFQIRAGDLSGQLILGTAPASFNPWRGDLYSISLYLSALSPQEIRLHHDALSQQLPPSPQSQSLLAHYPFSESSGRIAHSSVSTAPDLQMPKRFFPPYKPFLQPPLSQYEPNWAYYRDVFANIIGFLPFGFLLCAYLANTRFSRHAVFYSFLAGASFSFIIELLQGYIPQRDSGFNDVITNGLGALLGALLAHRLRRD